MGTSDHLLLVFCLCSAHFFIDYLMAVRKGRAGRLRDLYLGALFMGLAGLSKYNAVFLGLGLAAYILCSPRLRRLLLNPHLYLAALLVLVVLAPVLIWNVQHGFASFRYHLVDRQDAGFLVTIDLSNLKDFALITLAALGPFLIWGYFRFALSPPRQSFERTAWGLGSWVFWLSTATFTFISLTQQVFFWWNMTAYMLFMPFMGKVLGGRFVFWGHTVIGVIMSLLYVVSSTIFPVLLLFGLSDPTRTRYFGWDQLEAPIERARERLQPDFIASSKWEYASLVGFVTDDPNVVSINPRLSQYHYWFTPEQHRGENALLVTYNNQEMRVLETQFATLTLVEEIPVVRFGRRFGTYRLFYGEGYKPAW